MTETVSSMKPTPVRWKVHLATSVILTVFLAYIDEGYYNFQWIFEPGIWIVLSIYIAIIWGFQLAMAAIFDLIMKDPWRTWFSTFGGSILGLSFMFWIVFSHV